MIIIQIQIIVKVHGSDYDNKLQTHIWSYVSIQNIIMNSVVAETISPINSSNISNGISNNSDHLW